MSTPGTSRLALLPSTRPAGEEIAVVRRYRLTRLKLNEPRPTGPERHSHLRRVYD